MDIKEYIASGVVELYVTGSLPENERLEFERMLTKYPELQEELKAVEDTFLDYAMAHAVQPKAELKLKILNSINAKALKTEVKVIPFWRSLDYRIAASIVIAILCAARALYYHSKWNETELKYATLVSDRDQLAGKLDQVNYSYQNTVSAFEVIRDQHTKAIALAATDTSKSFHAKVYWNSVTHQSYIDVQQLPNPGQGKQFQLWALVNGKPVDAGVFNVTAQTALQRVKDIEKADAWAVTLEPEGGSVSPTLDKMYLLSKG